MRHDGREVEDLRKISLELNKYANADSSVEMHWGKTHLICSVTAEKNGPAPLMVNYRELLFARKKEPEKTFNIEETSATEKFIRQNLRQCFNDELLEGYHFILDCTVVQADGGAEVACLTGGFLAIDEVCQKLVTARLLKENPLSQTIAAVQVGILADGQVVTDLDDAEEKKAVVIMQLVMNDQDDFLAMNVVTNDDAFNGSELNALILHGKNAITELIALQKATRLEGIEPLAEEKEILVATGNPGKAREFAEMFAPLGFVVKTLADFPNLPEVEETGRTFMENARLKAETISHLTQRLVIADDSGLTVEVLDGQPGIFSARYAGPQKNPASNNAKLLANLAGVPADKRQAAFHCALAVAAPDADTLLVEAQWTGTIATIPSGNDGFGYDPLFYVSELGKTAAELTPAEKNKISHRAKALALLKTQWPKWWEGVNK